MMFWEIIATVFAGFFLAGIALAARMIVKRLPKWIVPAAAGLGMIGFQVYSEYSWADDMIAKLPENTIVVATVADSTWYRPWSYVAPQTLKFVALDRTSIQPDPKDALRKQATLYFFERRAAAYPLGISVDCRAPVLDFDETMSQNIVAALCKDSDQTNATTKTP